MGDEKPQRNVELAAFRIAKYPVTNAQFRAFVNAGGYTDRWRHCWTQAGWAWREKEKRGGPADDLREPFQLANHPRVNVSWYEAWAFSRWLGKTLGFDVRLPTDAEWEKAARGADGRTYPWGDAFEEGRCNSGALGLRQTTAVGCFPTGASPYGVLDMSGNVIEWCLTQWSEGGARPGDDDPEGSASRALRGGSFGGLDLNVRCAFSYGFVPLNVIHSLGFRLVAPLNH